MIYLFNKVHLKPLALFDNNNKISRIIIGNNCTQVNDTSEKILIEQMYGELLFSEKDYSILIEKHFKEVKCNLDSNKYKNVNRHKRYFMADAGYDSKTNRDLLENLGF